MSNRQNQNPPSSDWTSNFAQQVPTTPTPETVTAETVVPTASDDPVSDRQERVDGFDQPTFSAASVLLVGAGSLGSEIGHGLVRKGIGRLVICDEDVVSASNLTRQKFYPDDLGTNKAVALANNLAREGTMGTQLEAYPQHFQDAVALGITFEPDTVVCAPDNDDARVAVAEHFYGDAPVVTMGLDPDANGGYVYVQERTGPCFRCFRPDPGGGGACPGAPAMIDPAKEAAGRALYAVDSVLMDRPRAWNLSEFYLSGEVSPDPRTVECRAECELCGGETG